MGRKVHPVGFRLGINRTWDSRWFANRKEYAAQLHEDRYIRDLVHGNTPRAGISLVEIERFPNSSDVTLHDSKAGMVIECNGANVKELRGSLQGLPGIHNNMVATAITEP